MSADSDIPTIDPEKEPEYVGVHSAIVDERCQNWVGETKDELERCGTPATHTVVQWTGKRLVQQGFCDDCGEPQDAPTDREWSGQEVEA